MEPTPIISTMPQPPTELKHFAENVPLTSSAQLPSESVTDSPAISNPVQDQAVQHVDSSQMQKTASLVQLSQQENVVVEKISGGYTWTRHILLFTLVLLSLIIIASLIYLNGKSIYQYGL